MEFINLQKKMLEAWKRKLLQYHGKNAIFQLNMRTLKKFLMNTATSGKHLIQEQILGYRKNLPNMD